MNSFNTIGGLVRDPELKYLPNSGKPVAEFSIAVDDAYSDYTNFFDCVAYDKTAENIANYFKQGKKIGISGRLRQDRWEKEGQKRSKVVIVVYQFDFIGKKDE